MSSPENQACVQCSEIIDEPPVPEIPLFNKKNSELWDLFLKQHFPDTWSKLHHRPVFLPGEPVGAFGPTNYIDAELWSTWEKKWKKRQGACLYGSSQL